MLLGRKSLWGFLLILVGALLLAQNIFGFDIPIWGIIWPLVLIYFGLSILYQPKKYADDFTAVFDESRTETTDTHRDYSALFGTLEVDFSNRKITSKGEGYEVNAVFGKAIVFINSETPVKIIATGVFGSIDLPDHRSTAFSERIYTNKSYKENKPCLLIKANAVFGSVEIIEK